MQCGLHFAARWPLWLLAALPLVCWLAWRHRSGLSGLRVASAATLRCAAIVLVMLALMGPTVQRGVREISVVYAIDISHSVSPGFLGDALEWIRDANAQHTPAQVRYVVFADQATLLTRVDDAVSIAATPQASAAFHA